ncbi:helix-turn-helix transcriptional regulator [Actinomycetospora straminea]|uniref:helix-turn-helix transcriptional regulator n=1 Tax=Actinomycetospora straminea TaxID=663607 RepID=UPI0023656075|nr:helix-turn-helix transcriptional regulator [Actinomycetospora straminea]MDD7936151.1 helix-turn-helix transcriptional regulator [Actinomycetospora straminea]
MRTDHDDVDRFYREFGERLHDKRVQAGMSQEALGAAVGLNRTSISNIEKGRQRLLMHQLPVLAGLLSTTTEDLLPAAPAPDALGGLTGADRDAVNAIRQARGAATTAIHGVGHGSAR